jgi:hypothetical protein
LQLGRGELPERNPYSRVMDDSRELVRFGKFMNRRDPFIGDVPCRRPNAIQVARENSAELPPGQTRLNVFEEGVDFARCALRLGIAR